MKTKDIGFENFPTDFNADINTVFIKNPTYIKQEPYVGDDGIYIPCQEYVKEGCSSVYRCIMTKKLFVEAYNKWIKND